MALTKQELAAALTSSAGQLAKQAEAATDDDKAKAYLPSVAQDSAGVEKEEVLLRAQRPAELAAKIAAAERGEDDEDEYADDEYDEDEDEGEVEEEEDDDDPPRGKRR